MAAGGGFPGLASWLLAAAGAGAGAALGLPSLSPAPDPAAADFALAAPDGRVVSGASLRGAPFVLLFGSGGGCGEDCAARLARLARWRSALGPKGAGLRIVLVSVEPEHDTPARRDARLPGLPPGVLGLTGSREAVAAAARTYGASLLTAPLCGGGSAAVTSRAAFLVDPAGRTRSTISPDEAASSAITKLRQLIAA